MAAFLFSLYTIRPENGRKIGSDLLCREMIQKMLPRFNQGNGLI